MNYYTYTTSLLVFITCAAFAGTNDSQGPASTKARCTTAEQVEWVVQNNSDAAAQMKIAEVQIQDILAGKIKSAERTNAVVYVPVVFHVIYKTTQQNVSDTRLQSQIDVLNQDFSKTNSDWSNTPAIWQSLVANTQIQFCLATKDPNGNLTNGMIHKATSVTSWIKDDKMKSSSTGGDDAWDPTQYLNIWICNYPPGLGYAYPPGAAPSSGVDGVVIDYTAVTGGIAPYNLGRTVTHEVGHYFALKHIWGDGQVKCGNDSVADTPTAEKAHLGCKTGCDLKGCFPHPYHIDSCNSLNGEMTMNYMDYTDDKCMYMFTLGQSARMNAALVGPRASLLTAASAKCSTTGLTNYTTLADLVSVYPNPSKGDVFLTVATNAGSILISIYNSVGQLVESNYMTVPTNREVKLNFSEYINGIYSIHAVMPEGVVIKKVSLTK